MELPKVLVSIQLIKTEKPSVVKVRVPEVYESLGFTEDSDRNLLMTMFVKEDEKDFKNEIEFFVMPVGTVVNKDEEIGKLLYQLYRDGNVFCIFEKINADNG